MTKHIMVDLETWGTGSNADGRSLGAVVFDPVTGTLGETFYVNIKTPWWMRLFLKRDRSTKKWWSQQSREAQEVLLINQVSMPKALRMFAKWWDHQETCPPGSTYARLWAHGPHFDEVILRKWYRVARQEEPWHYRAPRDVRTILEAAGLDPKNDIPDYGTAHNALDDCKAQALAVMKAMTLLGSGDKDRISNLLAYNNGQVEIRRRIANAARALRSAQRAYMADRGNDYLGQQVASAATELDLVLSEIHA